MNSNDFPVLFMVYNFSFNLLSKYVNFHHPTFASNLASSSYNR